MEITARERQKGLAAISAVTLLWSINFVAARPAALAFDPVLLTFLRAVAASAVFLPLLRIRGEASTLTGRNLLAAVPLALACIAANQVLFLTASRLTTPTHVAVVVATIPVFVAIAARVFLGEHLAPRRILGILVAFAGVALLAFQRGAHGLTEPRPAGDLMALLATMSFALYTVGNKTFVRRVGPFAATTLVYLAGVLVLFPVALPALLRFPFAAIGKREWLSALYLVVGATILAYPLFSYALARLTASRVAVFTYLQPLGAATLSYALGWERFPPGMILAALLAVSGVALAQRRVDGRRTTPEPARQPTVTVPRGI